MERRALIGWGALLALGAFAGCAATSNDRPASPAVGVIVTPKPVLYVATLRVLSADGPERPQMMPPLLRLLRRRGWDARALQQQTPDANDLVVTQVVMTRSELRPPDTLTNQGSVSREVEGQLRLADGSSKKLGPFSTYATFGMEDWGQMDLRPGAAEPLLEDAFVPMADAITREKPG